MQERRESQKRLLLLALWRMGDHRLLCGDARSERDLKALLNGDLAAIAFLDSPYNVRIRSVVGRGV